MSNKNVTQVDITEATTPMHVNALLNNGKNICGNKYRRMDGF